MVIEETRLLIQERYGSCLKEITVERLVIGVFFTGVRLSNGRGGISYTPTSDIHRQHEPVPTFTRKRSPCYVGASVDEILRRSDDSPLLKTVKIVILNALSESLLSHGNYTIVDDRDALDIIDIGRVKRVAMVGAIGPILRRLKERGGLEIRVIEKKKESLQDDEEIFFAAPEEAAEIIPLCDTVILTGATIANGTIDGLLSMARTEATVIVAGPTASLLPDALFKEGVDIVSGVWITKPDKALDMLGEGMTAIDLFADCAKKINVVNTTKRRPCD
jgi:uncharacterized protein (DUF4213/DUF364 family)